MNHEATRYAQLLAEIVLAPGDADMEVELSEVCELGRLCVEKAIPPDELINIHHKALEALASGHPDLLFSELAGRLTSPLMELSMAYGLAFRQQSENRFNALVQARLEQVSRLQSVGTLAAGVAHDFNNIIGCVVGYAELTTDALPMNSSAADNMRQILIACDRAQDLIKRLISFARQRSSEAIEVDILAEIREALKLVKLSVRAQVQLVLHLGLDSARVHADPGSLMQLIMNLCLNANDAIANQGQIDIFITQASRAVIRPPLGRESNVCILVRDNGQGIAPEILNQIFDPFFTTKEPGKGSGLGLSVVHGIVMQLNGEICARSETQGVNTGTDFAVFLPCNWQSLPLDPPVVEVLRTAENTFTRPQAPH